MNTAKPNDLSLDFNHPSKMCGCISIRPEGNECKTPNVHQTARGPELLISG